MTVEPRMKISPVSEFRPYLLRFTVSAAVGAVLGVVGAGFLLYFDIVILLILLGISGYTGLAVGELGRRSEGFLRRKCCIAYCRTRT